MATAGTGPCHIIVWCSHGLSMDAAVVPGGGGGQLEGWGFTSAGPPEQLICGTWFTLVFLSSTGLSHLHPTGARWVQGESVCCYLCCISSLHVGAARARWEDRSVPAPAAGAWPQPLLQPQLILFPSPKSWGLLQGTGAAVPALLGKDQADTTDGEWLPVLNNGSPGQGAAPCAGSGWAPGSPPALLPPGPAVLASEGPSAVPGAALDPLSQGAGPGLRHVLEQLREREDGSGQSGSQWASFAIPHPGAR